MSEELKDHGVFNINDDPLTAALDMALRGATAPHILYTDGMGGAKVSAVMMHVLGAIAQHGGVAEEIVMGDDNSFWDGIKANLRSGYACGKAMEAAERRAVN